VDVVVEQVVPLAGDEVDAVDVDGHLRVFLGHGHLARAAVLLARGGEDDPHVRVALAAGLQQRQLAAAVDVQVGFGVLHRVHVADLAGEVEDEVLAHDELPDLLVVAHVGVADRHAVGDVPNVVGVAAVLGDQRVDDQDLGAEVQQARGEVRADEAHTPRDQGFRALVFVERVGHQVRRRLPAWRRLTRGGPLVCAAWPSR
jgi:hypothetical protein